MQLNCHFLKGAVMNSKLSKMKTVVVVAALVAGVSGVVRADNSMSMWTGDSYAAFNGGRNFPYGSPALNMAPSTFTQTNPNGLSERDYQALSNEDPIWQTPDPDAARQLAATDTATAWRMSHPHGFTAREYEAIAANSVGIPWRLTPADTAAIAAENEAAVARLAGKVPLGQRIAQVLQGRGATPNN
jgi:hypothetical protein